MKKKTWDNLDLLARTNGTNSSIVQIVPASPQRYDRPWKVSGREERKNIRCCDGATAYTWAFGREHALKEIYQAFPSILGEAIGAKGSSPFKSDDMLMWYSISLPE